MKILILDDTEYVLEFLKRELKEHDVHVFMNPEKFLAEVDGTVNVIITDLKVARYDAIKHIRQFKRLNSTVKVIVISAHFTEEIFFSLIDCHIYKAVKKTHEIDWFKEVAEAVNK